MTRGLPQEKGLPQASEGPPQAKNPTGDMAFFLLPRFLPLFFHQPHHSLSFIQLFFVRFPWCCKGKCVSLLSRFVAGQRASGPRTNSYALVFLVFVVVFVLAAPRAPPRKNSCGVNSSSTHLGEAAAALRLSTGEDSCLIRVSVSCSTGWHRTVGRPDFVKGVV